MFDRKAYTHKYYLDHKEKFMEDKKQWRINHSGDNKTESQKTLYERRKRQTINRLGGKCSNCGCDIYEALEINHINGGGNEERKTTSGITFFNQIIRGERNDVEVTCKVCNAIHTLVKLKKLGDHWKVSYE